MSDSEEADKPPESQVLRQAEFSRRDGDEVTRRVETLPHLIARSRRPGQPESASENTSLEEDTFNPTDDLFDDDFDEDFFDELFEAE